ncbi:hypothetical protein BDZ91DRAFT_731618, partial [Kalaharituber pfeilii]
DCYDPADDEEIFDTYGYAVVGEAIEDRKKYNRAELVARQAADCSPRKCLIDKATKKASADVVSEWLSTQCIPALESPEPPGNQFILERDSCSYSDLQVATHELSRPDPSHRWDRKLKKIPAMRVPKVKANKSQARLATGSQLVENLSERIRSHDNKLICGFEQTWGRKASEEEHAPHLGCDQHSTQSGSSQSIIRSSSQGVETSGDSANSLERGLTLSPYGSYESAAYTEMKKPLGSFQSGSYVTKLCQNEEPRPIIQKKASFLNKLLRSQK